jgi:hypothetical protein
MPLVKVKEAVIKNSFIRGRQCLLNSLLIKSCVLYVFGIKCGTRIEVIEKVVSSYTGYTSVDAHMYIAELRMEIDMTVMKKPVHKKRSHKHESWVEFRGYVFTFPLVTVFVPKYAKQGKLQIIKNPLFELTYENISDEGYINLPFFGTLALRIAPPFIAMWTYRDLSERIAPQGFVIHGSGVSTSMSLFEAMIM